MIDLNPLHYVLNWTAIGSGVVALVLGHFHGKYNLSGRVWDGVKTFFTSESVKVKSEMEAIKAKLETQNTKDIQDLKAEVAALKAKLPQ